MAIALYPGSFDPLHDGHVHVVKIASQIFETVYVAAMYNPAKEGFLPLEQREELLGECFSKIDNVITMSSPDLVVQAAQSVSASHLVKGIRGPSDLESEIQMAQTNKTVSGIQTIFIPAEPQLSYLSSRFIREISLQGGDITGLVPDEVANYLAKGE
ncbi:MAG: pantetheine-phosphate adenylyltransferase [Acidimicrobiaceae bacterium]|nr:pantetheine-phosphate adenylyltransferase [Acidimicrobiaceae bacterium]|tara:strand:+ start:999 stop:1469 length:471 start_codon:yes stop_codon:yes gene_type:complete